jgi:hypothetical protein
MIAFWQQRAKVLCMAMNAALFAGENARKQSRLAAQIRSREMQARAAHTVPVSFREKTCGWLKGFWSKIRPFGVHRWQAFGLVCLCFESIRYS